MASAWGLSWGGAWGESWGLVEIVEPPVQEIVVGGKYPEHLLWKHARKHKKEPPELVPVESSTLKEVGYDSDFHELTIKFRDDAVYHYSQVPESVHKELMDSESKGKYFHNQMRGNYFYVRRK